MTRHPDRIRPLDGATNFRDLGGYAAADGRRVRWGRLYRSDHLAGLSAPDLQSLAALGLRHAVDFRGERESAAQHYALPGIRRHALSIEPTVAQRMEALERSGEPLTPAHMAELMCELYRRLVNEQAHRFAALFELLLTEDDPLVFHCTAGKDRTGLAAALILRALGVPAQTVMADFLLTNEVYRHPPMPNARLPAEVLAVLWGVQPGFLEEAFDTIDRDQGGLPRYLEQRLGLTAPRQEALRARLLEAAP